jgi:hypothetical protein
MWSSTGKAKGAREGGKRGQDFGACIPIMAITSWQVIILWIPVNSRDLGNSPFSLDFSFLVAKPKGPHLSI